MSLHPAVERLRSGDWGTEDDTLRQCVAAVFAEGVPVSDPEWRYAIVDEIANMRDGGEFGDDCARAADAFLRAMGHGATS